MNFFRWNMKTRLAPLMIIIMMLAVVLMITSVNQIRILKELHTLTKVTVRISNMQITLDSAENHLVNKLPIDESFFRTGKSQLIDYIIEITNKHNITLNNFAANFYINADSGILANASDLYYLLSEYQIQLKNYSNNVNKRGFAGYGYIGRVNYLIDSMLNKEQTVLSNKTKQDFLLLSNIKNDYFIKKDPALLAKFNFEAENAITSLIFSGQIQRELLVNNIQQVENLINEIAIIDRTLGLSKTDGILGKLRSIREAINIKTQFLDNQLEAKINQRLLYGYILISLFFILLMASIIVLYAVFIKTILTPLDLIMKFIIALVNGKLPEHLNFKKHDEIAQMGQYLNRFVDSLKAKAEFAIEIGKGKLNILYEPLSEDDILGNALINMEKSLQKAELEDIKYKEEEKKRIWTNEGLALFSEILRQHSNNIVTLSDEIIKNLVKYINASQGSLYYYNDDNKDDIHIELVSVFANNRKKYLNQKIIMGEGLVGTCAIEREKIYVTDIPDNYSFITSGLGESSPRALLLIPLKLEEELLGVIELASFYPFLDHQIEFVEKIAESIASTIISAKINARTSKLLEQSQKQAQEMAEQEEEMRQNMEELRTTQEDFSRREAEIAGIINAINSSTLQLVFDMAGKIIDINQVFLNILGAKREDIVGRHHREITTTLKNEEVNKLWLSLNKGNTNNLIERIRLYNGKDLWLNQSFNAILDRTGVPYKVLCLSTDITDARLKEVDLTETKQMLVNQTHEFEYLHEAINSSLIYCSFMADGKIEDVNDNYCRVSGHSRLELIGKNYSIYLNEDEKNQIDKIWNEVIKDKTYNGSIKRTQPTGNQVWFMASFTPIKDKDGNVIKVYMIGQDITERKLKYQLLEEANKEIERLKNLKNIE